MRCGLGKDAFKQGLPRPSVGELSKPLITQAKKAEERAWLGEASAVVLQQSLGDLENGPWPRTLNTSMRLGPG
ncbi:hypothetical protein ADK75_17865 [Streptomyces virginiae]|uniref:Uncharacterized protein n=1 Tax=Streptomyces virginiae TaxID=1961 RepID=A0A0L8MIV6_STRVG|nr:hypothetical protein ADK75_17865 [Streptomyces virginiae]